MNNAPFREGLVPADEAKALILADADPRNTETIPLNDAANRVLAEDLAALRTQPPFNASAMDGYAVKAADVARVPVVLKVIGSAPAGRPFNGNVNAGEAVRIFTGGVLPDGADAIVIQENTNVDGENVTVVASASSGKFIRPAGMDFKTGDRLLNRGDLLDAPRLTLAASMNHAEVPVYKKPLVAVIATGDELVPPGSNLVHGQIIASNSYGLTALIAESGGEVLNLGIVGDTVQALGNAINQALDADAEIIVTIGGASVGDHDLVKPAMASAGFVFLFHKIAMRPGKPLLFAKRIDGNDLCRMIGLAGNPVSSLVAASVFLKQIGRASCRERV